MLAKILGILTILIGLLWLVKPEILKNRLKKKMGRKLKFTVYGFVIVFGFLVAGSVFRAPGLLPKILAIIGLFIAIKGILLITSRASDKMIEWIAAKPLGVFRVWAVFVVGTGIMLLVS
jgi:hypothetical protein